MWLIHKTSAPVTLPHCSLSKEVCLHVQSEWCGRKGERSAPLGVWGSDPVRDVGRGIAGEVTWRDVLRKQAPGVLELHRIEEPVNCKRPRYLCVTNKEEIKSLLITVGIDCKTYLDFRDTTMWKACVLELMRDVIYQGPLLFCISLTQDTITILGILSTKGFNTESRTHEIAAGAGLAGASCGTAELPCWESH